MVRFSAIQIRFALEFMVSAVEIAKRALVILLRTIAAAFGVAFCGVLKRRMSIFKVPWIL